MARLLAALGWLSILFVTLHGAAVPTQVTMVVSHTEAHISTEDTTTQEVPKAVEVTTEGPLLPIKLTEMEVRSQVSLRYAHTAVVAHVRNPAHRAQEATFRVLLPETAFISGFVMTIDGKSYKAYVKEKEEAKQIYLTAVSHGIGAAHIATKARDSNHFTVSVNVEGNMSAVFNLTYEELLVRRNGVYNHAINLHPGVLVPKLTVTVNIQETQKITDLRVPAIRTGNEIDATKDDAQNSQAVIVKSADEKGATITFTPDLDEQTRLMSIYNEKSKASSSHDWQRGREDDTQGVLGQFVVQYDVDHSKPGEVLVNDGYFVHFFAPTDLIPLSKHVIFVLDTSGSMSGRKIEQLREAMQIILSELYPGDFFSIVEFDSSVQVHDLKEADRDQEPNHYSYYGFSLSPLTLLPPSEATPENIAKAKIIVSRLGAYGGTNIYDALDVAVRLAQMGVGWTQPVNFTTRATPPTTNDEDQDVETARSSDRTANVADKSVADRDEGKKLEPIIIFLTDGDPNVGESRPSVIINHITEKNYGDKKATIFSLAFGGDADRKFLRQLSLRNDGFMRHIYEAADAALQLRHFYRQVSSPLLAHVNFTYPVEQVKANSLTKRKFRTYYGGSELVVAGRVDDTIVELSPTLEGFCGVGILDDVALRTHGRKRYETSERVPVTRNKNSFLPLERLWAYLTIRQLLDEKDALNGEPADKNNSSEKKALDLALKYSFVTPLTSLVVVKPNDTKAVDAHSVDEPHAESHYQSSYSVLPSSLLVGAPHFGAYSAQAAGVSYMPSLPVEAQPVSLSLPAYEYEYEDYNLDRSAASSISSHHSIYPSSYWSGSGLSGSHAYHYHHAAPFLKSDRSEASSFSSHHSIYPSSFWSGSGLSGSHAYHYQHAAPFLKSAGPVLSTPATTPVLSSLPDLAPYHLESFNWARTLLDTTQDSLVLTVNGTNVILKLTKDSEAPRKSEGDESCPKAVTGSAGVCVYLTRCSAAQHMQADQYSETYCSVDGFAGVCCPQDKANNRAA